ncbi:putative defense protein 1 [Acipenser ruthenus]|uniref:putative defense protein 1 n=1 Tax=Acipenser ruthenus TaxID=7906 RepID=UPI00145A9DB9|nr:putative defense protein 1 [Acipenser ruthenus]
MARWTGTALLCVTLLQGLRMTTTLPNGAPLSACEDMMPQHSGVVPQPGPAPYTIQVSNSSYETGVPVTVRILGPDYRGLLLKAVVPGSTSALGSWQDPPENTRFLQCSGNRQGAITHANTNLKNKETVYEWIPPSGKSSIQFMATVAENRERYWLNVKSEMLSGSVAATGAGLLVLLSSLLLALLYSR